MEYRNFLSYQSNLEQEIESWEPYYRGMRPPDQAIFTDICNKSKIMPDALVKNRVLASEGLFMGIFFNNQKHIASLKEKVKDLKEKMTSLTQE